MLASVHGLLFVWALGAVVVVWQATQREPAWQMAALFLVAGLAIYGAPRQSSPLALGHKPATHLRQQYDISPSSLK